MAFIENIGLPGLCCLAVFVPIGVATAIVIGLAKAKSDSRRTKGSPGGDDGGVGGDW